MPDETPQALVTRFGQKAVISPEGVVEGWLAPFGGPMKGGRDLDGEAFTAKTDFALDYYPTIPILYAHGRDPEVGAAKVGEITVKEIRDKGLWVQGQLDKQSAYYEALGELASKGDLYWSSGAIAHLVDKDTKGFIKSWPVAEATLTLTPANPDATAALKEADESETFSSNLLGVSLTINYPTKEGRRLSAANIARLQRIVAEINDLTSEPEPAPEVAEEKSIEEPPAYVLSLKGDDVEQPTDDDFSSMKALLLDAARAEARRLTG